MEQLANATPALFWISLVMVGLLWVFHEGFAEDVETSQRRLRYRLGDQEELARDLEGQKTCLSFCRVGFALWGSVCVASFFTWMILR